MKQRIFLLTLLFLLILTRTNDISAKETKLNEDMFTNVENTLKDKEIDLSYTQLVKQLIHGNVKGVLHTIKAKMKEVFLNRMLIQKDLIREILLIAFTAAIFKNLSDSFFQQSTANSAFYITYVILCGVMVHSFFYLNKTVTQLVTLMADYMKGMIMAYSLAVVSTSGITTSTTVYEFYLLLIYAMTTLTNVVLLPMIKILFVLKIINHISKEEHFSRLCKTLEGVIKFLLKGFLSVLLGVQLIQSMIFQDELNRVTKTPEDVLSKREKESYAKGVDSAQRSYEKIKEELLEYAKQGKYETVNSKKRITYKYKSDNLWDTFLDNILNLKIRNVTINKSFFNKHGQAAQEAWFYIKDQVAFDAYMETLQELCRKDGISTKLTVCYNSLQGEKTYDIDEKIIDYVLVSYTLKVYIICTVEY